MIMTIIKRDGREEPFNPAKINGWGEWAARSLTKRVNWSEVVVKTVSQLPDVCTSQHLQDALIRNCILADSWAYNRMAGRLYAAVMRREIYAAHTKEDMPSVLSVHQTLMSVGYMRELDYSLADYAKIERMIKHDRDYQYPHFQLYQLRNKYALRNRLGSEEYETPQFIYMRMAMALAETQPLDRRLQDVKKWYDLFSLNKLNAPTPNYVNLGTNHNGYASCCLYTTNDTAESLSVGDHIAYMMTVNSAGIGSNIQTRAMGDGVRGGLIKHQGRILPQ